MLVSKHWFQNIEFDFVIDGEILPFQALQKRLNRKTISKKQLTEYPIGFFLYDCLEFESEDIRHLSIVNRKKTLEKIASKIDSSQVKFSDSISFHSWEELAKIREESRSHKSEGLMLKRKSSSYAVGRVKGDWWKWKVAPYTIDAVLIYAQRGHGRRSGYYTDYTFAVQTDEGLVTIAKAYSGLTNAEIQEVSKFVRNNAIEKFGPVRTVKPELVFGIAFEGIAKSNRHKSGIALRFPRIHRWRKDKTIHEIDHINTLLKMI